MNNISIVAGGRLFTDFFKAIRTSDYAIGVDRGAYWLISNNIIPDVAIGDFDSVTTSEFQMIKEKANRIDKYSKKKDFTDMELAVEHAITLRPKELVIYGSIGTRFDHTMGNVFLLERLNKAGIAGVIRDRNNEVRIVSNHITVRKETRYPYISLLPITETIEVTLKGFAYDVSHALIRRGQTLGISNELRQDEGIIEVHEGKALLIQSRD